MEITYSAPITAQHDKSKTSDSAYLVEFVDLPDTLTEGATQEEALLQTWRAPWTPVGRKPSDWKINTIGPA